MQMHQIRYFLALTEELNFGRAARKCCVAQPSLTKAIKSLEAEFGGLLFHRERNGAQLTELGRLVEPYLQIVWAQARTAATSARQYVQKEDAPLRLGVMCTIAPSRFAPLMESMRRIHPGVKLEIVDRNANELTKALLAGELDVSVLCPAAQTDDEKLHYIQLFHEPMVAVVGCGHPLSANGPIDLNQLEGQNYLARTHCEFNFTNDHVLLARMSKWKTVLRSERDDWVLEMAAKNMGFGFMAESCVSPSPQLMVRPIRSPELKRSICLTTVRGRQHSPAVGSLLRAVGCIKWDPDCAGSAAAMSGSHDNSIVLGQQ